MSERDPAKDPPQGETPHEKRMRRFLAVGALFAVLAGFLQYFIGERAGIERRISGLALQALAAVLFSMAWVRLETRRPLRGGGFASAGTGLTLAAAFVLWAGPAPHRTPPPRREPPHPVIATLAGALPDVVRGDLAGFQTPINATGMAAADNVSVLAGTGETVTSVARDRTMDRLAGRDAVLGDSGDGGPAADALLDYASDVARLPDGSIIVAEERRLRRIGTDGVIRPVADPGHVLRSPSGVGVDSAGRLYVADSSAHRVLRMDPDGRFAPVAGTGKKGYGGDGGAATGARLNDPTDVEVRPDGAVLIADSGNARIRLVQTDGVIRTLAGAGPDRGLTRDGVPATDARLGSFLDVAVGPDRTVYIADAGSNRVRTVGPDGLIRTFAGDGGANVHGDGGPPVSAGLAAPSAVTVAPDGVVYVAAVGRIRVIGPPDRIGGWAAAAPAGGDAAPGFSGEVKNEPGALEPFLAYVEEHKSRPVALDVWFSVPEPGPGTASYVSVPARCFDLGRGEDPENATCERYDVVVRGARRSIPYSRGVARLTGLFRYGGSEGPHMGEFTVILIAVS